jgi:hypothetical protein
MSKFLEKSSWIGSTIGMSASGTGYVSIKYKTTTRKATSLSSPSFTYTGGILVVNGFTGNGSFSFGPAGDPISKSAGGGDGIDTYYKWHINGWIDPEGAPTYLETLDKLDQWSSAHYVPHNNKALNY